MEASAKTLAAPPISFFIRPIERPGLIFKPPVSKQTPFPTNVTLGPLFPCLILSNLGSWEDARPTA